MSRMISAAVLALVLSLPAVAAPLPYQRMERGVSVRTPAGTLVVQVCSERVMRVLYGPGAGRPAHKSFVVNAAWPKTPFNVKATSRALEVTTPKLRARIDRNTSVISFYDAAGGLLLAEAPGGRAMPPTTLAGKPAHGARQAFRLSPGEALYGLGGHQDGVMSWRGSDLTLIQDNTEDVNPVLLSSRGYGLLWDNASRTTFSAGGFRPIPVASLSTDDGESGGLTGAYYAGRDFGERKVVRKDPGVSFSWSKAPAEGLGASDFSVRWSGFLRTGAAGEYAFQTESDDGVRLWVNGKRIINNWSIHAPALDAGSVRLPANAKVPVRLEMFQGGGGAVARLKWREPGLASSMTWDSDVADALDYYVMAGPDLDRVIASYRQATGAAPMFGKWAYGLFQCKEHYHTQQELLDVTAEYRRRRIPLDTIVQDWYYWEPNPWGSHQFDPTRYPDPAAAFRTIHDRYKAHVMISVWPKFIGTSANKTELANKGLLLPELYSNARYYDPYSAEGRRIYWRQLRDQLFSKGVDAWWLDATEPEVNWPINIQALRDIPTGMGPAARVLNAYSLFTTKGVYEGQRQAAPNKRVLILTRSVFAGQQRNAAVTWSGDIEGTWDVFRRQVPAGLNFCMAGVPYWCTDIGGFFGGNPLDPGYRELFLRWFQYGAFCPVFRVHGTNYPKEMWRFGPEAERIQVAYDNLRYRLLPYIYSSAWDVTSNGGTMMRGLAMDFRTDPKALDIPDQFMFGPAFLVNPVVQAGATKRDVYLPRSAGWVDFWTGERFGAGRTVAAKAPIERIPLYVRAGSIVPMGPELQYATEKPEDPIELRVFPGADGRFTLYEDENEGYGYERGVYATIPVTWNDASRTLTIGRRSGRFPGMLARRTFRVVLVRPGHGVGRLETPRPDRVVPYAGAPVSIHL